MRSGSGSIEAWSCVRHVNTQSIASRQVTSGSAVVLLELEVLVLLEVVLIGPVVDVEGAAGRAFSSESKQPATGPTHAPSASRATSRRGVKPRAEEAKDIGATVAAIGARDEPVQALASSSAIPTNPTSSPAGAACHRSDARTQ